jgi:hypothetical protein
VERDPELKKYSGAWKAIEKVTKRRAELLGQYGGFSGRYYGIAEQLVFMAAEDQKPNAERLREYSEAGRASLEQQLFSPAPIHPELEQVKLADSIGLLVERRGGDDPLVREVLSGKSPQERAAELVQGTRLGEVDVRRQLADGGQAAIEASDDPLIQLARRMEPVARDLRKQNDELDERERQAYTKITEAKYAVQGTDTYPDATFTLRLAFGTVDGYTDNGQPVAPRTTLGGAFEDERRHGGEPPWDLPDRWHQGKGDLDLETPYNFVCTADIIGGNSGSPVISRDGRLVGVIFDGNLHSLTGRYLYSKKKDRAVAVHIAAMLETLRRLYDAERLVAEMGM